MVDNRFIATPAQRKELYDALMGEFANIATWSDFYVSMHKTFAEWQKCHCPMHSIASLQLYYVFILAMESLPEEGDIRVLVERMCHIMAYESKERLGVELLNMFEKGTPVLSLAKSALLPMLAAAGNGPVSLGSETGGMSAEDMLSRKNLH